MTTINSDVVGRVIIVVITAAATDSSMTSHVDDVTSRNMST